jgi:hypothetical protein
MWFGMETGRVRAAALAVGEFTEQAADVASGCLAGLSESADVVRHPEVAAALRDYRDDVVPLARMLPAEVDSLSVRTTQAALDIESGDDEALADLLLPWRSNAHLADTLLHTRLSVGGRR